jgi:hypothetical protein
MRELFNSRVALMALVAIVGFGRNVKAADADAPATQPTTQPGSAPLFSDDFESGSIDTAKWDVRVAGKATVKVEQDKAAHGKSALQIHYPSGSGSKDYGFIVAAHLPDAVREHFFGRASMFVSASIPVGHDPAIFAGSPGWPVSNFLELGLHGTTLQPSYQQNGANIARAETIKRTTTTYPMGKWFLMEFEFNDKPDAMTIWIDGNKVQSPTFAYGGAATNLTKGFSDFGFGFRAWGAGAKADFDMYYDDIAIDTKRIGPVK